MFKVLLHRLKKWNADRLSLDVQIDNLINEIAQSGRHVVNGRVVCMNCHGVNEDYNLERTLILQDRYDHLIAV